MNFTEYSKPAKLKSRGLTLLLPALLGLLLSSAAGAQDPSLTSAPGNYVLDQPEFLPEPLQGAVEAILIEHDRLSGEQILLAVFKDAPDAIAPFARELYRAWGIGLRGKGNGALLVVDAKDERMHLEVGYGLGSLLAPEKAKTILEKNLRPEWDDGNPGRGLVLGILGILRALESPLLDTDEAQRLLRAGGFEGSFEPASRRIESLWVLWVLLGALLSLCALYLLTAAEIHFTSAGWYKLPPWIQLRRLASRSVAKLRGEKPGFTGGGVDGSW